MGPNRRVQERERAAGRAAAEAKRAEAERKAVAVAQKIVAIWNARQAGGRALWFYPTIGAAIAAGVPWLTFSCPACQAGRRRGSADARPTPGAAISSLIPSISCRRCSPNTPFARLGGCDRSSHAKLIIAAAARYKLPAVYIQRPFVESGGLISYGPNFLDQYRRAADYVSRILKGEKPADLPVQAPNKYELAINLKTAKALGLDVPPSLLARADEVIE
jgi:ABC transporter substrate binding protein